MSKFGDWLFGPDTRNNPQHDHRWKTKSVTPVYDDWNKRPVMHLYLLECEVCGDLKTHKHKG